jgi:cell fate (sporulation/competence/biofilm development) regulator YlbF (YheA/YmcA/DUF963 family)
VSHTPNECSALEEAKKQYQEDKQAKKQAKRHSKKWRQKLKAVQAETHADQDALPKGEKAHSIQCL